MIAGNPKQTKIAISVLVLIHFLITLLHGRAHSTLSIGLPPITSAFVLVVIVIAPLISGFLIWTRYAFAGLWIFFLSNLGAFFFGVYHHYILISPDNIAHLPQGAQLAHSTFIITAVLLALLELCGLLYGAFRLKSYGKS